MQLLSVRKPSIFGILFVTIKRGAKEYYISLTGSIAKDLNVGFGLHLVAKISILLRRKKVEIGANESKNWKCHD